MTGTQKALAITASIAAVVGALGYLLVSGFGESIIYYKTVDELLAEPGKWTERPVRINGNLVPGSIRQRPGTDQYRFALSKRGQRVEIAYTGILPDAMQEDRDLVVHGTWQPQGELFAASEILTKCPSKYEDQARAISP